MINISDLRFGYENKKIFDRLNVEFKKDYFYAVLGPSGHGKSTLLKIIAGYLQPEAGSVQIPKVCGYVLQGGGLFNHLKVAENISIQAVQDDWDQEKIYSRINQLCELTRFPKELLHIYPNKLSGGQKQRAAIMRALFMDSDLILLDEAFNGLDLILKVDLLNELKVIFKNLKKTVIMVTHDLIETQIFADQVLVVENGQIIENLKRSDFFRSPQSDFGKQLINAYEIGRKSL